MSSPGNGPLARLTWRGLLIATSLLMAARAVQLAVWTPRTAELPQEIPTAVDQAAVNAATGGDSAYQQHAEIARLYLACPASAVVNWDDVVQCAQRGQFDAAMARVTDRVPDAWSRRNNGQTPRIAYPTAVRVATANDLANSADAAPKASAAIDSEGWLVDPDDWYSEEDRQRLQSDRAEVDATRPAESSTSAQPNEVPVPEVAPTESEAAREPAPPMETTEPRDPIFAPPESESTSDAGESEPPAAIRFPDPKRPVLLFPGESSTTGSNKSPATQLPPPSSPADRPVFSAPEQPRDASPADNLPNTASPAEERPVFSSPEQLPAPPSAAPFEPPVVPDKAESPTEATPQRPSNRPVFSPPPALDSPPASDSTTDNEDPHLELFAKKNYPSARECGKCHEKIYEEWSNSSHAYAMVSPMFQKFEQKITELSQGTVGYFCYRCHSPVGTTMCIDRTTPLWQLPEVAREGVTCIACHRVQYRYGKSNGERRIEPGPIFAPVFGGIGGDGVAETIHRKDHFKVKTSPHEKGPGQEIHVAGIYFDQLSKSEFCASCHQVAVHPGIKLEVVWEQYRASPACRKGIRCQDCHMGRVPGVPSGFEFGPAAVVAGKKVNEHRKHSNHVFYGPGYSIAHPGVFPFHLKADRWTIDQWLLFDWRAGWGTVDFEDAVDAGQVHADFPPVWKEADDRYDAREIIEDNLKKLTAKREIRTQVMENGSHVDGPFFAAEPCVGKDLRFHFLVTNTNEGHNLLTASLGAQPQFWANVVLIGPDGRRLWETGYTDSYGDVADIHSVDVRQGRVPFDWQLFNLQTMFLITGVKGTDREFYLPVNVDIDQLPFLRPGVQPISTINHPPFIRMESRSLAALGSRKVPYRVPGRLLRQRGVYRLSFRMRSRAEPIYFMRFVGATTDMQRSMNERMIDVHPYSVEFVVR